MTDNTALEVLKSRADALGLPYHHRAGPDKIADIINAHLVQNPYAEADLEPQVEPRMVEIAGVMCDVSHVPEVDPKMGGVLDEKGFKVFRDNLASKIRPAHSRLRRVRLQNMNPAKKDWPGEWISVGSAKLGTFKKYIPFNGEPYHIPQIIYDMLKERQCTVFYNAKNPQGGPDIRKGKLMKEYAVEDLPPLTREELDDLAARQALAGNGL